MLIMAELRDATSGAGGREEG